MIRSDHDRGAGADRAHKGPCRCASALVVIAAIPFVGLTAQTFEGGERTADVVFGAPIGAILGKYAIGHAPAGSTGINLTLLLRAITKVLGWRLRGRAWPHPFFHLKTREPIYPLKVLTAEQREALRPLCGPKPALRAQA